MQFQNIGSSYFYILLYAFLFILVTGCGCTSVRYGFNDVSIPADVKTIRVNIIENRARYINPQLSPQLTDRLKQKITGQTKLTQVNSEDADWTVNAYISDYSVTTSGIANQRGETNKLNVTVHVTVVRKTTNDEKQYDISRGFDFSANKTLQSAEAELGETILRSLTDDIFNRIFSEW
ncbi:MAG: hypothetical protein C4308_02940 [Chitinophagaceae bacterium]